MLDYAKYVRQKIEQYIFFSDETRKQTKQMILLLEGPGGLPLIHLNFSEYKDRKLLSIVDK